MQKLDDIKFSYPLPWITKLVKTGRSATIDTADSHSTMIIIATGSTAIASKFYFYHVSASTTLAASGTAFTTNPTLTTAATACQCHAVLFQNQPGMKRYIRILMSKIATSAVTGALAISTYNRAVPPSATLGAFTSVIRPTV